MTTLTATEALAKLTPKGRAFMVMVANRGFDFFDDGLVEHSGNWGENLSWQYASAQGLSPKSSSGVMGGLKKAGLFVTNGEQDGDSGEWWTLTALGAEVAKLLVEAPAPEAKPAVKVCKKDASHGEHRVTRTGSYCYACDRLAAEAQKAKKSPAAVVTAYFEARGRKAPTQQAAIDACYADLQAGRCLHLADWDHQTTDGPLGDAYFCQECKGLAQVG